MDGMSVARLLFALNEKLGIDLLPIFNEFQEAFELDGQGRLTETSRQRLGQLLPGAGFAVEGLTSLDDLWSVAIVETLVGQQLQRLATGLAFEPISNEKQQAWVRELPRELGERKLRLLLAAACRYALQKEPTLTPAVVDALDLLERFADTGKTKKALRDFRRTMSDDWFQGGGYLPRTPEYRGSHPYRALYDALAPSNPEEAVTSVAHAIECVYELSEGDAVKEVRRFHSDLVSPLAAGEEFAAAWRTPSAVQLAQSMYASRDFGAMPRLADALEQAGCASQAVLDHCRDPDAIHIRGCWVVDAVLNGKWPEAAPPPPPPNRFPSGEPAEARTVVDQRADGERGGSSDAGRALGQAMGLPRLHEIARRDGCGNRRPLRPLV
jgi:hypothetical protein